MLHLCIIHKKVTGNILQLKCHVDISVGVANMSCFPFSGIKVRFEWYNTVLLDSLVPV